MNTIKSAYIFTLILVVNIFACSPANSQIFIKKIASIPWNIVLGNPSTNAYDFWKYNPYCITQERSLLYSSNEITRLLKDIKKCRNLRPLKIDIRLSCILENKNKSDTLSISQNGEIIIGKKYYKTNKKFLEILAQNLPCVHKEQIESFIKSII